MMQLGKPSKGTPKDKRLKENKRDDKPFGGKKGTTVRKEGEMTDYIYALDGEGNLIPGTDLRFAYSGAGVATLVNREGRGYRVPLEAVEALDALSVQPHEQAIAQPVEDVSPAVFADDGTERVAEPGKLESGPFGESAMEEIVQAEAGILAADPGYPVTGAIATPYAEMTNAALKDLLDERGIEYPFTANKAALVALAEGGDE